MALDSYPQELQGVIKLLNNYTTESEKDRNSRKTYVKEQTRVSFTQTQYKNINENKETKIKGELHCFHCREKYHWEEVCLDLEEEQHGKLHANVGILEIL